MTMTETTDTEKKKRKSKHGQGIYKDEKSGLYGIRIDHAGKYYRKLIDKDKRKAKLALEEAKQEIRLAKLAGQNWEGFTKLQKAQKAKTFAEAAGDYMEERQSNKASCVDSYQSILKAHLLPAFGKLALRDIKESDIRKFQSQLSAEGTSKKKKAPITVNNIMQLLRNIFAQAYRQGDIERNPTLAVRRVETEKHEVDPFSEEELRSALANVEEHYRPFFTAQAYTGARPNELQALRWADIDWKNDYVKINKGRVRGEEGLPKTKSGNREIPMSDYLKTVLQDLKERRSAEKVVSLKDYVFTTPNGEPINKHMDRIWARALKKADVRHRSSYQLRHTFVTQCINKGFPLPFIAKVIGHSTIDTLIRHYASYIDEHRKEDDARLRDAFKSFTADSQPAPAETNVLTAVPGRKAQ